LEIAVSSKDYRSVSGHAGQAQRWLVFETDALKGASSCRRRWSSTASRIETASARWSCGADYPFAGEGFLDKMRKRGIECGRHGRRTPARRLPTTSPARSRRRRPAG
jgi:hypothetical protein